MSGKRPRPNDTQLGLGQLAEACEIGWHQGLDMYGADDNRLLAGFEYTAKYLLGNDVPFEPYTDTTGKYSAKVIARARGNVFARFTKWSGTTIKTAAASRHVHTRSRGQESTRRPRVRIRSPWLRHAAVFQSSRGPQLPLNPPRGNDVN